MTTWQDQQPMSRRALRESERAHAAATMPDTEVDMAAKTAFDQHIWAAPPRNDVSASPATNPQPSPAVEEPLRRPRRSGSDRSTTEPPAYRLRDFSPESRGASFTSTQSAPWTPPSPGSRDLSYQTSVSAHPVPPIEVTRDDAATPPEVAQEPRADVPMEHTLTRRELREMRNAAAEASATPPPAVPSPAPVFETTTDEVASAMSEFDSFYATRQNVSPIAEPPHAPVAETIAAEPLREVVTAPEVYSAPVQPNIDEQFEAVGGPHRRDLSAIDAITTSALVLPNFPVSSPSTGPVRGTGQILMTGSIALPRSLGVNGLHPSRYDRSDLDSIIDAGDLEESAPSSAPVRAVSAVSTYTSPQGILNAKRPKGNNLPMILSITAGVMMVGVVVLIVAGMIFKIF